jgi:flavorubredoxin
MVKILVIYDSNTGNTEKMARAVADGAASTGANVEIKKIGDPFPLSLLAEADGVAFGSPCIYADITDKMKDFLDHVESYAILGKMKMNGRKAAVFGSYGFDGAFVVEERLKVRVAALGYKVQDKTLEKVDTSIKVNPKVLEDCNAWGKEFAAQIN